MKCPSEVWREGVDLVIGEQFAKIQNPGRKGHPHKCAMIYLLYLEPVEEPLLFRRQPLHHPGVYLNVDYQPEKPQDPDAAQHDVETLSGA